MLDIDVNAPLPIGIAEIKNILQKQFGNDVIIKSDPKYRLYDVFMKGKGDLSDLKHCYATMRVGGKESSLGIQIRGRYKDPSWSNSVVVYPPKGSAKDHILIKRTENWADRVIDTIKKSFAACDAKEKQVAYAKSKTEPIKKAESKRTVKSEEVSEKKKESTKVAVPPMALEFVEVYEGALQGGWKCVKEVSASEIKKNPCKNVRAKKEGSSMLYYFNFTPDKVSNYADIKEGKKYSVPSLVCKSPKSGRNYMQCNFIKSGVKLSLVK